MKEKINQILVEAKEKLSTIDSLKLLNDFRVEFLGKSGKVTGLLKGMKDVAPELRPQVGQAVNGLRVEIEALVGEVEANLKAQETALRFKNEAIDISLPGKAPELGTLHPITLVKNLLIDAFSSLGFQIYEGPEIETDKNNFQMLNIPEDHPARDMQDTFYITESILLRTHTSPGQVHVMTSTQPPIKVMCPGRVYRSDDDATHSPIFHQIEGLVVDKNISLCDLKGSLEEILKHVFGPQIKTRLRPSYFPFTEPSVEIDVSCFECGGKGCKLCKGTGWIEVLGAGMVNKNVLQNCGIDPEVYTGYAFGIGLERIAMLKYHIPDIRMFFDNDLRFVKQFK
ncbi:MAG: phenylalanine--tRNA ligase subunit alpha [Clostridia bacterium]|nr:phenylalanine--tRNA ligase subunit alpha [Clostridia bacterium]MBQ4586997.1 phenylalanine--tRNA ligase subunit alpha [Clostridia bacterium]MBQ6883651.1 phenylalanine--tRNA ligase subunit alpha [Clostridia bacterium]MBR2932969.1 phenylalanine--tRNA ligase subunit alpha [Clostridia bacterium]MBR6687509.1 phenylalanine--tRNA ligase subunit alpha [Clostridia bacterium]